MHFLMHFLPILTVVNISNLQSLNLEFVGKIWANIRLEKIVYVDHDNFNWLNVIV